MTMMSRFLNEFHLTTLYYPGEMQIVRQHWLTREVYLLPDLLPAGDVGAALVDAEVWITDVSEEDKLIKLLFSWFNID